MKSVSVGSPEKLTEYKAVETESPARLETYIHKLLEPYRAPNGEFFNVTTAQLEDAIREAARLVSESQPFIDQTKRLQRKKPTSTLLEPSENVRALHQKLKAAVRESFFLEHKIEFLRNQLQVAIGENLGFRGVASWKWRDTWSLNQTLLKREEPDLYQKYREMSGTRVFRLE